MNKPRRWKALTPRISKRASDSTSFDTPIRGISISICYQKQASRVRQAFIVSTVSIFIGGETKYRQFNAHSYELFCEQWDQIVDTMVEFRQMQRAGDNWRKIPFGEDLYYRKKHLARAQLEQKLCEAA